MVCESEIRLVDISGNIVEDYYPITTVPIIKSLYVSASIYPK